MNVKVQKKYTYFECANRKSVCALPVVTERLAKGILEHIKKHEMGKAESIEHKH